MSDMPVFVVVPNPLPPPSFLIDSSWFPFWFPDGHVYDPNFWFGTWSDNKFSEKSLSTFGCYRRADERHGNTNHNQNHELPAKIDQNVKKKKKKRERERERIGEKNNEMELF